MSLNEVRGGNPRSIRQQGSRALCLASLLMVTRPQSKHRRVVYRFPWSTTFTPTDLICADLIFLARSLVETASPAPPPLLQAGHTHDTSNRVPQRCKSRPGFEASLRTILHSRLVTLDSRGRSLNGKWCQDLQKCLGIWQWHLHIATFQWAVLRRSLQDLPLNVSFDSSD